MVVLASAVEGKLARVTLTLTLTLNPSEVAQEDEFGRCRHKMKVLFGGGS